MFAFVRWVAGAGSEAAKTVVQPAAPARKLWQQPLVLALAAVTIAAAAALSIWYLKPAPPLPVTRTVIALPPDQQLPAGNYPLVALSPDGKQLVYVASRGGAPQQLFLRAMDGLEARPIPSTEGGFAPFFSPDGQWVGFFQSGALKKVSVNGGAAVTLSPTGDPRGASWGSAGSIIFAPGTGVALQQISDQGGALQPLFKLENGDQTQRWPDVFPGGKAVLFASGIDAANARIVAQTVGTEKRKTLVQAGTSPRYAPSGHLLYLQGTTLMAVPFDPERLEMKGAAVPTVEGVTQGSSGVGQYDFSNTGTLVYVSGGVTAVQRKLVWVNRAGKEEVLAAPAREYDNPRISPDGKRVAVEVENQIWLYDLSRDTLTRFTFEGGTNADPAWTPDGKRISFRSNKDGPYNIYWQLADGSGGLERLTTGQFVQIPKSWSPDGQTLAFHENNDTTRKDIWVLRMGDPSSAAAGSGQARKAEPFLRTPFNEGAAIFSPDGHWLAYMSDESARQEIYIQPYPGPGGKWQISTDGGTEPAWNRNGRELFYRSRNKMMAVDVATQPTFSAGKPRMLFEGVYVSILPSQANSAYDVSPDGQRFLMVKETERATSNTQINVVLNWFEDLKRRASVGKK